MLNERIYRRGAETHQLPLLSLFAASNHLPEDEALRALFDRFLLRCHVDNLQREEMPRLLAAGWELERAGPLESSVSAADLRALAGEVYRVELGGIVERYAEVVSKVRDLGVALTDRRAVKVLKLVAASAVLCGRSDARVSDFWVLRYVWDREEQVAPLAALVAGVIAPHAGEPDAHPLATVPDRVNAEELARRLDAVAAEVQSRSLEPGGRGPRPRAARRAVRSRRLGRRRRGPQTPGQPRRRLAEMDRLAGIASRGPSSHSTRVPPRRLSGMTMAMNPRWQDVCCASIPVQDLPVLADLRRLPGIRVSILGDRAWVCWEAGSESTRQVMIERLLPLSGVEMFARRGGHWYRPGEHLPAFGVPIGDGSGGVLLERRRSSPGR